MLRRDLRIIGVRRRIVGLGGRLRGLALVRRVRVRWLVMSSNRSRVVLVSWVLLRVLLVLGVVGGRWQALCRVGVMLEEAHVSMYSR
jgi:hypothetical protein